MTETLTYEKVKIVKMKKEERPSKYKKGKTFSSVVFVDEKNKKIKAMGKWTKQWKEGMEVEGFLKRTAYDNDWGTRTVSYYLEENKPDSMSDDQIRCLYRQGLLNVPDDQLDDFLDLYDLN